MSTPPRIDGETRRQITRRKRVLERFTNLVEERVEIPGADVTLAITRPESIDAVLDHVIDDPEQNLPYWAEIWPSGIALATTVLNNPGLISRLPVIELGCGLGITAASALMSGANLTITDYSPHSLLLAEINCLRAGQILPVSRELNWRNVNAHLLQDSGERWPVVLAGDVLYEQRDIEPVLDVLDRITAPEGMVLLAEPGRRPARDAINLARERGWHIETTSHTGPWPDPKEAEVVVSVHSMRR